jgi:diketogulonate reductase-like aldo/keto reductase
VAQRRALPPAQVALAWLLGRPGVTAPIVGATKAAHIDDAVAALEIALDEDDVARLETPYQPHPSAATSRQTTLGRRPARCYGLEMARKVVPVAERTE